MNLETYKILCEDFTKKSDLMDKWCEASTKERKKLRSYETLKKEAQAALQKLEDWINTN